MPFRNRQGSNLIYCLVSLPDGSHSMIEYFQKSVLHFMQNHCLCCNGVRNNFGIDLSKRSEHKSLKQEDCVSASSHLLHHNKDHNKVITSLSLSHYNLKFLNSLNIKTTINLCHKLTHCFWVENSIDSLCSVLI